MGSPAARQSRPAGDRIWGMSDGAEATSRISIAVYALLQRRASGNPTMLSDYLKELEQVGTLNRQEILAVADAVMRAYEQGKMP